MAEFKLPRAYRKMLSQAGAKGGTQRGKTLTPKQRKDQAKAAADARWAKKREAANAGTGEGDK